MVGKKAEAGGIAKDGAKMVGSCCHCKSSKITILIGGSFGATKYAMNGRVINHDSICQFKNFSHGR